MSTKWVISDLHLGHKNILKYSGALRGGTTGPEHDAWLIAQINSVVKKCDLLYILGDVAFDYESLCLLKKIKGQKLLVRGNHDTLTANKYLEFFTNIQGLVSHKGTFWLSHAPIHPAELRGRINIHGHVHQNSILDESGHPDKRYINACVETTYGIPQNLDVLLDTYKQQVHLARQAAWRENEAAT